MRDRKPSGIVVLLCAVAVIVLVGAGIVAYFQYWFFEGFDNRY